MQIVLKILVAIAALAIAWQVGQLSSTAQDAQTAARTETPTSRPVPTTGQFRGMAIQLHGGPGVYEHYHRLIPEVADLGANTVLFVVHGWQDHAGSMNLRIDAKRTAHAEDIGKLCDLAGRHGLRTILMPIVLLANPRNTEWRGRIIPPNHDWDGWFKRYTKLIVHFAKIAERHRVEVLMVGSELIKSESSTRRWQDVIREIRQHYRGKLGYSANWDHYQTHKIGFWADLDYVGMTTYYQLADGPNPAIEEIDQNWSRYKKEILAFQREVRKPIIFTEVGWCSQEGAAKEGWNYYANQKPSKAGRTEQTNLYRSFLRTWASEPTVGGIIWWEWNTSEGGNTDYNYTPRNKPAEKILREWFQGRQIAPNGSK